MKNILIPSDFSASSRNAVLYGLHLMKGRDCNFYLKGIGSCLNSADSSLSPNPEKEECIIFATKHEAKDLEKKVKKFFPEEKFHFYALNSYADVSLVEKQLSLIIVSNNVNNFDTVGLNKSLPKLDAPLLLIPPKGLFIPPKKVLLLLAPNIEANPAILNPLKRFYGNHNFSLEIHKISAGDLKDEISKRMADKLFGIFDSYRPVVKFFSFNEYQRNKEAERQQKFDVELLPVSNYNMERKLSDDSYLKSLSGLEVPLLIIPGFEKNYPVNYNRSRKNRKTTFLST
ncbi:hypothetical protein [Salinimicrobium xinjiangense]|uniref:hypothetical protein n=1 Tax=Salinimicrobium xinjiangense TaxID=438596 RepID=UPI0003FAAD22|nr:hypothetical protein [Salinimicrobium xinjiangense]